MNEKEIKNYIDGNSLEFKHFKLYADSTLKNMTKDELISYIHTIYHNWKCADIEKERLHKIICDLTNNQPYKFEDLKVGMLVYDIKPEYEDFKIFKITKILTKEECEYLYKDKDKKVFFDNRYNYAREFEEGRYFPITKAMEVKK